MACIRVGFEVAACAPDSPRAMEMACMFGVGLDESRRVCIVPSREIDLPLERGGVVFITGPSGGGKSTLLKQIEAQLPIVAPTRTRYLTYVATRALPDRPLVDQFDAPLEAVMELLARTGLAEAALMLRRPCEISEGQRHRLRLAHLIHDAEESNEMTDDALVVLADELGSSLDAMTASIVARGLARWARGRHALLIAASAHDELMESLEPDVLIWKGLGDAMEVIVR